MLVLTHTISDIIFVFFLIEIWKRCGELEVWEENSDLYDGWRPHRKSIAQPGRKRAL